MDLHLFRRALGQGVLLIPVAVLLILLVALLARSPLGTYVGLDGNVETSPEQSRPNVILLIGSASSAAQVARIMAEWAGVQTLTDAEAQALRRNPWSVHDWLNRRIGLGWTTDAHTAVDVPVFAAGPGAQRLAGSGDLVDVFHAMQHVLIPAADPPRGNR